MPARAIATAARLTPVQIHTSPRKGYVKFLILGSGWGTLVTINWGKMIFVKYIFGKSSFFPVCQFSSICKQQVFQIVVFSPKKSLKLFIIVLKI